VIVDEVAGAWGLEHDTVWELVGEVSVSTDVVLKAGLRGRAHPLDHGVSRA
jgi:hypothetical protein